MKAQRSIEQDGLSHGFGFEVVLNEVATRRCWYL